MHRVHCFVASCLQPIPCTADSPSWIDYEYLHIILIGSEAIFNTTFVKSILAMYKGLQILPARPFFFWSTLEACTCACYLSAVDEHWPIHILYSAWVTLNSVWLPKLAQWLFMNVIECICAVGRSVRKLLLAMLIMGASTALQQSIMTNVNHILEFNQ